MDKCAGDGGGVLCFADASLFLLSVCILLTTVRLMQVWLLRQRLACLSKCRTAKTVIFLSVSLENLSFSIELWFKKEPAAILHLFHDDSKFVLFTVVLYYFSLHAFQILGSSRSAKLITRGLTGVNLVFLSAFSADVIYDLVNDKSENFCKSRRYADAIWLTMCAGNCVLSLVLVAVGIIAVKFLKKTTNVQNKKRESKLWFIVWVMFASSFIELAYDSYLIGRKPNQLCVGLFPVSFIQDNDSVGNSLSWLFHKLITSTLVDISILYAFWPTKKVHSPLLKEFEADEYDENDVSLVTRKSVSKTVSSESGLSLFEEDKSQESSRKSNR